MANRPIIVTDDSNARSILLRVIEQEVAHAKVRLGFSERGQLDYHVRNGAHAAKAIKARVERLSRTAARSLASAKRALRAYARAQKALGRMGLVLQANDERAVLTEKERERVFATVEVALTAKRDKLTKILQEARVVAVGPEEEIRDAMLKLQERIDAVVREE